MHTAYLTTWSLLALTSALLVVAAAVIDHVPAARSHARRFVRDVRELIRDELDRCRWH